MQVDESFTGYVVARWTMLHRLAVLLVGPERAEGVATAGLVSAYLGWREIQESAWVDDRVKELLARAALDGPADPGEAGLAALPTRRRVVLVLRRFELLPEGEVARILRCHVEEVAAEESAALAGLGWSARDLTSELTRLLEDEPVPVPPVDELLARGRDERRRRTRRAVSWTAGAAVVLLVVVSAATVLGGNGASDRPARPGSTEVPMAIPAALEDLAPGGGPRLPYVERSVLQYDDSRVVSLGTFPSAVVTTGDAVYVAYADGVVDRVDADTMVREEIAEDALGEVVVDPRGRLLAWMEQDRREIRVHLRSIDGDEPPRNETRTLEDSPGCCDVKYLLAGITRSGEVVVSAPDGAAAWVWDTRLGSVSRVSGIGNGVVAQVTGDEIVVHHPPAYFAIGRLRDGDLLVDQEIGAEQADFADPLGKRVVYAEDGQIHVRLLEPYGRSRSLRDVRLALPVLYVPWSSVRWEDSGHLLLDVADASLPNGALVRCDVQSGACELAARFESEHLLSR
jgi:hypothetical protein